MTTSVDRARSGGQETVASDAHSFSQADVPAMMAGRIGDLYAEEERQRRILRTERMIRRAESLK
jgi:hypothetical protein